MPKHSVLREAPSTFHPRRELRNLSWDDLKIFVLCAHHNSFREAARAIGTHSSSVVRRIDRLEREFSIRLFQRLPEGIKLTSEGQDIAERCRQMEYSLLDFKLRATLGEQSQKGEATLAVTEGLGTYWVMPQLVAFQRSHPQINVTLLCEMQSVDVLRLEADFSIQFSRPKSMDLLTQKLGYLHLYPFAAPAYLDTYGYPGSFEDLQHHRFVQQVSPELDNAAFAAYFRLERPSEQVTLKTNTSSAHLYALENGAGIGGLPNFALALGAPVVPVDVGSGFALEIWLTAHPDSRRLPYKSLVLDWLKSIFDSTVYPWFGDNFIHPSQLAEQFSSADQINKASRSLGANPKLTVISAKASRSKDRPRSGLGKPNVASATKTF